MNLSKHKSGYYYVYFIDTFTRKRRSISTKCKLKCDAIKFLSGFEKEYRNKSEYKTIPITLKEFSNKYLIYSATRNTYKSSKNYRTTFNLLIDYFGNINLSNLSPSRMSEYIEHRLRTRSVYAARRDLINLSCAFNKAVQDNYLLENPCKNIKRISLPERQPIFFTVNEYHILLRVIEDMIFKYLVELAINWLFISL